MYDWKGYEQTIWTDILVTTLKRIFGQHISTKSILITKTEVTDQTNFLSKFIIK